MGDPKEAKFNEQAFLLDFFSEIVERNIDVHTKRLKDYRHFIQITGDSAALTNRLLTAGNPNILWNLTNEQVAMLVPRISIYKIEKKGSKSVTRKFNFNEYTSVEDITKTARKRGRDATLKSFTWEDLGTNPGDSGLAFKATLKIKFQSFDGVFADRGGGLKFADLLVPSGMSRGKPASQKKEIRSKLCGPFAKRKIDPTSFQIKAILGWAVPRDPNRVIFSKPGDIVSTQVALILTLTSHDIDIKEDGAVDLTINYMAAIEGRALSPKQDLLKVEETEVGITMAAKTERRRALQNQLRNEKLKLNNPKTTPADKAALRQGIKTKEKLIAGITQGLGEWNKGERKKAYGRLLTQIEGWNDQHGKTSTRRLLYVDVNKSQIAAYKDMTSETFNEVKDLTDRQDKIRDYRRRRKKEIKDVSTVANQLSIYQEQTADYSQLSLLNQELAKAADKDARKEVLDKWRQGQSDDSEEALQAAQKGSEEFKLFFFYFGDLIEAALNTLWTNPATKNINYADPLDLGLILGTIDLYNTDKDSIVTVPLADIPISLTVFQSWFQKNILEPNATVLPFLVFLKKIVSELITGVLGPQSFGAGANKKAEHTKISLTSFLGYKKGIVVDKSDKVNGRIHVKNIKGNMSQSAVGKDLSNLRQYYFLYVGGITNNTLKGNEKKDKGRGIFHVHLGKDRGLIKKVNFKRTDLPMQREARILGSKDEAASNLLFSDHYNSEITMIGNAIFKPGMLIFINPTGLGLEPVATTCSQIQGSWSSKLGIGGYYLVTRVESVIEEGKFETVLGLVAEAPIYQSQPVAVYSPPAGTTSKASSKTPAKPKPSVTTKPPPKPITNKPPPKPKKEPPLRPAGGGRIIF